MVCPKFKAKKPADRKSAVEAHGLCFNCLGRHRLNDCSSKRTCSVCCAKHHSSLHDAYRGPVEAPPVTTAHFSHNRAATKSAVLLDTARVRLTDRFGAQHPVRALIDQGSESSFVTESLAQRLRLRRSTSVVRVFGVGGHQTGTTKGSVTVTMSPVDGEVSYRVHAHILPRLTEYCGGRRVSTSSWAHLSGLSLADPEFSADDPIELLLGVEIHSAIIQQGLRKGGPKEPVAQNTTLGWLISGITTDETKASTVSVNHCHAEDDLTALVRRFWEQEELPQTPAPLSPDEEECEDIFRRTHIRSPEGRYIVRLPLRQPLPDLTGTGRTAARMLVRLETRFARDSTLEVMYKNFMNEYESLQHMSRVELDGNISGCYLPHHGVLKEASTTTKLRVVFNGSSPVANGETLNDHLLVGPNLLPALFDVLLRWRWPRYVIAADIEKMYRQIQVHPSDRNLQRVKWRDNAHEDMRDYTLNTVTYGLACAPFLAIRTLKQLAADEEARFPVGAAALRRDSYVDDILTGASTLSETLRIRDELIGICRAGGFPLKKWSANTAELLAGLPDLDLFQSTHRSWQPSESHAMLGVQWHPNSDHFSFSVKEESSAAASKRAILSRVAQLFDPLGWIAPVTVRAKLFIQTAWLRGLDWDTPLAEGDQDDWQQFQRELPLLGALRIDRWLCHGAAEHSIEVHGFADASERAFAAVLYLRAKTDDNKFRVTLMCAKSKVAPIKPVSLPRLELCASHLLARLTAHVVRTLGLQAPIHLWSDSTIALTWITAHLSRWKTYVANRVADIQSTVPSARWHHIAGKENPADCASRGLAPGALSTFGLWWHGPSWLSSSPGPWTTHTMTETAADVPEQRRLPVTSHVATAAEPDLLRRYSSLSRLLRITAWCRRAVCRLPSVVGEERDEATGSEVRPLTAAELEAALKAWIRVVQSGFFKDALNTLQARH
ncbi:PREDICTED: uncharacterized protein LOC105555741 [Vollenhovia emeryi]|uniref:uncharacterized protein LOC105555741 n=1 Tax=Vollenhovia emeryi TaxID=411798 RepID=UPI0005F463F4|nr:PREDICTED: uncharacterized protein LOC105555741 [Vollenhovia emeryi]